MVPGYGGQHGLIRLGIPAALCRTLDHRICARGAYKQKVILLAADISITAKVRTHTQASHLHRPPKMCSTERSYARRKRIRFDLISFKPLESSS